MMKSQEIRFMQKVIGKYTWVHVLLVGIARFGYVLYIVYGIVEWFRPASFRELQQRRHTLLYCLFSVMIGSGISFIIGKIWRRRRPFVKDASLGLIPHTDNASFPSNHTANSTAVGLHLLQHRAMLGPVLTVYSMVLGFSRIYTGVHYVTDVLGGVILGAISHFLVARRSWAIRWADSICYGCAVLEVLAKKWWHLR